MGGPRGGHGPPLYTEVDGAPFNGCEESVPAPLLSPRRRRSAPSTSGRSRRAAARSTGTTAGSASPGSAASPGTGRRPGGRGAAGAGQGAVEEVARVELESGLVGGDAQGAAGGVLAQGGDVLGAVGDALVEHPVVVEALGGDQLRVGVPDVPADRLGPAEVEGRAGHPGQFSGGDQARVGGGEAGGGDRQLVVLDRAAALAGQVPVDVAGEVDDGGLVGGGLVVDAPVAAPGEGVRHLRPERARVAHLAVDAGVVEHQAGVRAVGEGLDVPDPVVEAEGAAVQGVLPVVDGELVLLAVQGETALGDAVAVPPDQGAEVRAAGDVVVEVVEAQRDVGVAAPAVRDLQGLHDAAVRQHLHPRAAVLQRPAVHLRPVGEPAEEFLHGFPASRGVRRAADRGGGHAGRCRRRDDRSSAQFHTCGSCTSVRRSGPRREWRGPRSVTNRPCACSTRRTRPPPAAPRP